MFNLNIKITFPLQLCGQSSLLAQNNYKLSGQVTVPS